MRALLGLMLPLALLGGDEFAVGVRAYQEGRFRDAYDAFTAAELAAGHSASAELLFNRALAALRVGELRVAEYTAEKAVARGGPEFAARRAFFFGNAAYLRCLRSEAEAGMTDADPTAYARAINYAERAIESWKQAASRRPNWPEARRNVERALIKLEELKKKQEEAEKKRRARKEKPPPEDGQPDNPDKDEIEQDVTPQLEPDELTPDLIAQLLAVLDKKEMEKRALRRAQRQVRTADVERDW